jgi:chaperonin GroES
MAKKLAISPIAGTKNRVFVKPAPAEEKTSGGIIIPDTAKEKPQRGEVVAISDIDEDGKKPVVKVGDVVLYGKYSGTEISFEGQDFLSMRESDIIARLRVWEYGSVEITTHSILQKKHAQIFKFTNSQI